MKKTGRKPSSVTSSQGKRIAVKKKITKSKMGEKSTSYEGMKTSSAHCKTIKEEKTNVLQKVIGKGCSSTSIYSAGSYDETSLQGSYDETSSQGTNVVKKMQTMKFKKGGK
eukprot:11660997-Ditylum_brightwellii.AAC.1